MRLRALMILLGLACLGCEFAESPVLLRLSPPEAPSSAVLGLASWRFEWIDSAGNFARRDCAPGEAPEADFADSVAVPVLAYPFWPEQGIGPGVFRPAGTVYPWSAEKDRLSLTWRGGICGFFYRELSAAALGSDRRGALFDWERFSALLSDPVLPEAVLRDPWCVDWRSVALRTVASGFDRRRLVPRETETTSFQAPASGPWYSASPFQPVLNWGEAEPVDLPLGIEAESFVSPAGLLRCSSQSWAFYPWPGP